MDANLKKIAKLISTECTRLTMENIAIYDVESHSPLTCVVIIATAGHTMQLDAARSSLALIGKKNSLPLKNPTEDYSDGWLALDHGDYVVHILTPEKRDFYRLDDLMEGIKKSRENQEELDEGTPSPEGELQETELPPLSESDLARLNAEFDFLSDEEAAELPPAQKKR